MTDFEMILIAKGKCCITGKPLKDCQSINMVQLSFAASWEYPVWGNILHSVPIKYALAVVHDHCVVDGVPYGTIKYAVEFSNGEIIYHPVPEPQKCRQCSCTENDACIHPLLGNCWWMEPDLCSHCVLKPGEAMRHSQLKDWE